MRLSIALLFPSYDHPAIEERYASWQAEMRLREGTAEVHFWEEGDSASDAAAAVKAEHVLVVTDPLLLAPRGLASRLLSRLGDSDAVVPSSNVAANPAQAAVPPSLYMTLRELDAVAEAMSRDGSLQQVAWDASDPAIFLCRTEMLDPITGPPSRALEGKRVVVSRGDYVHRWASMRGQVREDLLARIPTDVQSILEFGCGEASLGLAIKQRQHCRVAGIELDPNAAAVARKRIDVVYQGDAREIIALLGDRFDFIVGGDIVEHLDDPWSFLAELRRIATPGGRLLLSLPNIASASIIGDLLAGRFDYVYMGLTCAGHLRFFTRASIEEMLRMGGWTVVEITPQDLRPTPPGQELIRRLESAAIPFSRDDLMAGGYYVVARND
jgi:SAM-dependent methyltransferase